jgi:hypothetical protein
MLFMLIYADFRPVFGRSNLVPAETAGCRENSR